MTAFDRDAEEIIVGCCVASCAGWHLAQQRVSADDFYDPTLARIFQVCEGLPVESWESRVQAIGLDISSWLADPSEVTGQVVEALEVPQLVDLRIEAAAKAAGLYEFEVSRLVDERPVDVDVNGVYAARVRKAAHARHLMGCSAALYAAVDAGEPSDDLLSQLRQLLAAA